MNFLSPWFLLGAAAIAGPILFHLIRRAVRERLTFSSLMFLRPTPPKVTRRRRIENPWLLLLRCLALLLLAAGFARPFFARDIVAPASATEGRQLILLLDTSASMGREGMWDKARSIAENYLEKASSADRISLLTFDRQPRTLVSASEWSSWAVDQRTALARQRLATVSPSWMGTQLGLALTSAAEQFVNDSVKEKPDRQEIVLITDLQEGAKLDGLQGHEWPVGVKVTVETVSAKRHANAGLQVASLSSGKVGDENVIPVRVTNARDSGREKFRFGWSAGNNFTGETTEIYLPPGQSRTFPAPKAPSGMTELRLTGDEENFDNMTYYAAPELENLQIAYFGSDSANDPAKLRYYLQRVFNETLRRRVELVPSTNSLPAELLKPASFAVVPSAISIEEASALREWLTQGHTALMILSDAKMGPTLSTVADLPEVQITEAAGDYALLGEIDFKHPIFVAFADPRFSDFTHIHFWKHRRWEIPSSAQAHVLAKFDNGSPALVQLPVGKGNLLVLASGWQPADSQLAISSKFPPLIQTMLEWSGASASVRFQFQTGDPIPSPLAAGNAAVQWQKPDGKQISILAGTPFTETDSPGIYLATFGEKQRRFAVNLPLDESRTAPTSPDELARLGVPLKTAVEMPVAQLEKRAQHLKQSELENRQKLWRWLIVGVLAVTLGETILSGWLVRRAVKTETLA